MQSNRHKQSLLEHLYSPTIRSSETSSSGTVRLASKTTSVPKSPELGSPKTTTPERSSVAKQIDGVRPLIPAQSRSRQDNRVTEFPVLAETVSGTPGSKVNTKAVVAADATGQGISGTALTTWLETFPDDVLQVHNAHNVPIRDLPPSEPSDTPGSILSSGDGGAPSAPLAEPSEGLLGQIRWIIDDLSASLADSPRGLPCYSDCVSDKGSWSDAGSVEQEGNDEMGVEVAESLHLAEILPQKGYRQHQHGSRSESATSGNSSQTSSGESGNHTREGGSKRPFLDDTSGGSGDDGGRNNKRHKAFGDPPDPGGDDGLNVKESWQISCFIDNCSGKTPTPSELL